MTEAPDLEERTEPVERVATAELVAGEISLRAWPVRLGPVELDVLREVEAGRARLEEDRRRLREELGRLDEARELARREGFEQGLLEAREQAVARMDELVLRFGRELGETRAELLRRVPGIAARLAAGALGRELSADPGSWREWLARLLDQLRPAVQVSLRHHPGDGPRVEALLDHTRETRVGLSLSACPDESLAPGEVILETSSVRLDARLRSLAAVWERDLEEVHGEP